MFGNMRKVKPSTFKNVLMNHETLFRRYYGRLFPHEEARTLIQPHCCLSERLSLSTFNKMKTKCQNKIYLGEPL